MGKNHRKGPDLSGQRFGLLTAVSRAGRAKNYAVWRCECSCGQFVEVRSDRLKGGLKTMCSFRNHPKPVFGLSSLHRPTYSSWQHAWRRVRATDGKNWRNYAARGITVCYRWEKFENFLADMGPRPSVDYSLDRIDNDRGYEPGNCRWATLSQQRRNCRDTIWIEYLGVRHKLSDFCEAKGLSYSAVRSRLKIGWSVEKAVREPIRKKKPNKPAAE